MTSKIDWILLLAIAPLVGLSLITLYGFEGDNAFFIRQLWNLVVGLGMFALASHIDWRFLRETRFVLIAYGLIVLLLLSLFITGSIFKGAQSWFDLGVVAFQPADPAKLVLILILAKYFARRHVEIADFSHVVVSGLYAAVLFGLILIQPDFGSAVMIFLIWFGMVLVSGLSWRQVFSVAALVLVGLSAMWLFVFDDYQKQRVETFINPAADTLGAGYNVRQALIAIGSGGLWGQGIGYGTQARYGFLPEHESDFMFAAVAEEWGFVGVVLMLSLYAFVLVRIVLISLKGSTNFEILFGIGIALFFLSHLTIHIGGNLGLLPVTGTTIPFMSYGGSHIVTEFLALGMLMGMRRYERGDINAREINPFD